MRRYPLFVFDSREKFFPVAAEAILEVPGVALVKPDGSRRKLTSLDQLDGEGGHIDLPPNPEKWAPPIQEKHGGVGYLHRVEAGGLVWLQHHLYSLHNPKAWAGYGVHESDWEVVQVGYARDIPVCVTCSQHHAGEGRMWWDVETRAAEGPSRVTRPVIYVARDSHANYFEPVRGSIADDVCDGKGRTLDLQWREPGPWATWPGRWGASSGVGMSPESPGCQMQRWRTPQAYHSASR